MSRRTKIFLVLAAVSFVADQAAKVAARHWLDLGRAVPVIEDFFDWRLSFNTGSAFGLFSSIGGTRVWLTVVGLIALGAIVWMLRQSRDDQTRHAGALGLVAGGAVGNILDRVLFGKVTDFVVWRYYQHEWPTFNVADSMICVGAFLLLAQGLFARRSPRPSAAKTGA